MILLLEKVGNKKFLAVASFIVLFSILVLAANSEACCRIDLDSSGNTEQRLSVSGFSNDIMVKNIRPEGDILFPTSSSEEADSFLSCPNNYEYSDYEAFQNHREEGTTATCYPVIDGEWSDWSSWDCSPDSSCPDQECGSTTVDGTETRTRSCDDPEPNCGGSSCSGSSTESRDCTYKCNHGSCGVGETCEGGTCVEEEIDDPDPPDDDDDDDNGDDGDDGDDDNDDNGDDDDMCPDPPDSECECIDGCNQQRCPC